MSSSSDEQDVCVTCGVCCDHTLFDIVIIQPDEYVGSKFIDNETEYEGGRYFKLPCPYFKGCCSIYSEPKPRRCGEYRCNVLKRMTAGELEKQQALETIRNIKALRDEICAKYTEITGRNASFRDINKECNRLAEEEKLESSGLKELDIMVNFLQLQLVLVFRSRQVFDDHYFTM